jgi:MFS family permease
MNALIIGRALAGLGGGGMYLGVMMMLSLFTTPIERPKYIGIIGVVFGFGTVWVLCSILGETEMQDLIADHDIFATV